jgi:hypothetical protein
VGPIQTTDVLQAVREQRFLSKPFSYARDTWNYTQHVERIAYLAQHGWEDSIEVDIGIPSMDFHPQWPIQDGNHRLFAALARRDPFILASVAGEVSFIEKLLFRD